MPAPEIGFSKEAIDSFLDLHDFVDKVVAPWATQARISQTIASDYHEYEQTLSKNFSDAVTRSFSGSASGSSRITYLTPVFKPNKERDATDHIVINHGAMDWEVLDGRQVVQCYTTVYRENPRENWTAAVGSAGKYKDIHQDANGHIEIHEGIDGADHAKTSVGIFFVSVGQPLRALKWLDKYNADGGRAIIRQYAIPAEDYETFAKAAVPERFGGKSANSINVDVHAASDQYGLRPDHLALLKKKVIKGSLVSYTEDVGAVDKSVSGKLLPVSELRRRLGVPERGANNLNVFVKDNVFQSRNKFEGIADLLMSLYGAWWRNEQYLSDQWRSIPAAKQWVRLRRELETRKFTKDEIVWKLVQACYEGNQSPGMHARRILESRGAG